MKKNVKLDADKVTVSLTLTPHKTGSAKLRFYERDARAWVKEKHPKVVLGRTMKACVVKNQGPVNSGEWVFEVVQEKPKEKPREEFKQVVTKRKKTIAKKKEVANVEDPNGTV